MVELTHRSSSPRGIDAPGPAEVFLEFNFLPSRLRSSLRKEWPERLAMRVREKQGRCSYHNRER